MLTTAGFNRRMRKTACPVVWKGCGVQLPSAPSNHQIFSVAPCFVRAPSLESDKDSVVIPTRCSMSKSLLWRGSQVVRHGSAKAVFVGSIPTLASFFLTFF